MISQWPIYNGTWFHRRSRICFRMNSVSHSFLINVNRAVKYSLKTHVRNGIFKCISARILHVSGFHSSAGNYYKKEILFEQYATVSKNRVLIAHCFLGKCLDIHEVWKEVLTILNAVVHALTTL